MDNRPIGFFDSGLGGLTSIPYLMKALPKEKIIYFGDTARTPYGSKMPETISAFSAQITDFLISNNVKMIVIACNTITSTCLLELRNRHPETPILGIIEPAAKKVSQICSKENNIGIIGTKVTIKNNAYQTILEKLNPELNIYSAACPAFVPLIEEGILQNEIMDLTIKYYLDTFISYNKIDMLVLGCTHYPLIRENLEKIYPWIKIVNPSEEIIESIEQTLADNNMLSEGSDFDNTFYASDLSENFVNMINRIFENAEFKVAFKNFELDVL